MSRQRRARKAAQPAPKGMDRYTVDRLFGGVGDVVLRHCTLMALRTGTQLDASRADWQVLPVLTLLGGYALHCEGVELIEDWPALLRAQQEGLSEGGLCASPDLFFVSCICILDRRDQTPDRSAYESIGIPQLFAALVPLED